jgi:transcriptional regulator with XRE-family HTH domain
MDKKLPNLQTIGERVKYARNLLKLTQKEVATMAKYPGYHVIRDIEADRVKQPRHPDALAAALQVPVAWLMHGAELEGLNAQGIELAKRLSELSPEKQAALLALIND